MHQPRGGLKRASFFRGEKACAPSRELSQLLLRLLLLRGTFQLSRGGTSHHVRAKEVTHRCISSVKTKTMIKYLGFSWCILLLSSVAVFEAAAEAVEAVKQDELLPPLFQDVSCCHF